MHVWQCVIVLHMASSCSGERVPVPDQVVTHCLHAGEHRIPAGLFHNNAPAYMEDEVLLQKQLHVVGEPGAELRGVVVLETPCNISCWRPVAGGGTLEGLTIAFREEVGVDQVPHGVCVAVEGGDWAIRNCEVRCQISARRTGSRSRAWNPRHGPGTCWRGEAGS